MNTADIFLLVIIVAALLVGFFWGAARSLMFLAAWLVAFILGAYLQIQRRCLAVAPVDELRRLVQPGCGLRDHLPRVPAARADRDHHRDR